MDTALELRHIPVLLSQVLELAHVKSGMRVVDATLGGGGYTLALFDRVGESGRVLAFDWDEQAIRSFRERFAHDETVVKALEENRLVLINQPYSEIGTVLTEQGWDRVDVIVADLGLSSVQLDDPARGLSLKQDGPLDMRMNSRETVTAADIVNQWSETDLAELFRVYADEGESERIARAIVVERKKQPLLRTLELATLVKNNVVAARRRGRIHPATQVFQALRMAVNSETKHLNLFLEKSWECLSLGGRLIIVTFHSGEDGLVKRAFRNLVDQGVGELITKKPIQGDEDELRSNPRSRSAKLRGIQKKSV